jgi:hypothetical protein
MVMSRLIDADKLIEELEENNQKLDEQIKDERNWVQKKVYEAQLFTVVEIIQILKEQPSAFYIDKVVEQLECEEGTVCGHKFINKNCFGCEGCNDCKMEDAYRYAIDIVKAGGIDGN